MDPNYSFFADWLSKFHDSSLFIQALWVVCLTVTVAGTIQIVMNGLRDVFGSSRGVQQGTLIYAIFQDPRGRWISYRQGEAPREISWMDVPPELRDRGTWPSQSLQPPQDWR